MSFSKRIKRVNSLIVQELAKILFKDFEFPKGVLVTVTRVQTASDLKEAKVYISSLPENQGQQIVHFLNQKVYSIQKKLDKKLVMRPVPKIKFYPEKKTVEAGKIEEILERIKNQT